MPQVSGQVQGIGTTGVLGRVGIQAGPLGSTAEQSLATLLWKELQGSGVRIFNLVPQSEAFILTTCTREKKNNEEGKGDAC